MSESSNPKATRVGKALAVLIAAVAVLVVAVWYLRGPQFENRMRLKVISELEEMTGGRVELGSFHWNLSKLRFDVRDLTIHGKESPAEVPYAHVDHLLIDARITSLLHRDIVLDAVELTKPVVHIIVYPDGTTNQPTPKRVTKNDSTTVQDVLNLAIGHTEVRQGELIVNEQRWPLDFTADETTASMDYARGGKPRYDARVSVDRLTAKYGDFQPTPAQVSAEFSLFPNELELKSLHLSSGNSWVDATGTLTDFRQPVANVQYRASVNGPEVSHLIKLPELKAGTVELNGRLQYANGSFSSDGKAVGKQIEIRTPEVRMVNVDAAANFKVDPKQLVLSPFGARVFGGMMRGEVTVLNWGTTGEAQTGTAHLRVTGMPAHLAADAFSTRNFDLGQLRLAGTGSGNVDAKWRGKISRAIATGTIAFVAPAQARAGEMPLSGEVRGTYDAGPQRLHAESLELNLPDAQVSARGTLGSESEDLRLSATVRDLSRLRPLLAIVKADNGKAADLTGRMRFDGVLRGRIATPTIQGHVETSDFTFPLKAVAAGSNLAAAQAGAPQRVRLDSGSADIIYSPQRLAVINGQVKKGKAAASVNLNAGLVNGELAQGSPVTAHVEFRDASVGDLQQIAGYGYPVTGTAAANLDISGAVGNLDGGGRVQLTNGTVYGEPVKSASAHVRLAGQQLRVENLVASQNGSQIVGSGQYNLETGEYRFQTTGTNFQLEKLKALSRNKLDLEGLLNFTASGSGTPQSPVINASIRLQNFAVSGRRFGNATLTAVTQGDVLRLSGRSNFQNAELTTDGTIKVRHPLLPANITVRFTNFDFMPFLKTALRGRINGTSFVGGTVTVQGPLKQPRDLTIVTEIPELRAEMEGVQIRNAEPIRAQMINEVMRIESFKLVGTDTEMDVRGSVDIGGDRRIRLRSSGRLNMKLAETASPDISSSGLMDFNVVLSGTIGDPSLNGQVHVTNGAVNFIDFPNGLSKINGTLVFTEERAQVQNLTAHTGGGDIQIGGFVTFSPQLAFNLTAAGEDIRLRYPQGVSSTGNLDLKLTGTLASSTLSGDVTITRFGLNNQFDLAQLLAKSNRPSEAPAASPMNNVHLNLHVVSTPELQVQSSLAKLAGNVDLNVRGVAVNPVIMGRVNLTEGQFTLNGQTYRLERGDVVMTSPTRTEPTLDIEATTRVRDYDITVHLSGQADRRLKPTFRSDPPLQDADIINLLAFGRTREESQTLSTTQSSQSFTESVSNAVLGQAINTAVSNRVQRLFGVSRIKISPEVGSTTTNPTAQVMIEQQVSNKVTITYITNLAQSSQQSIFMEYNVNPNLSLVAGRDQYGVVSFDIRIRQRIR